MEPGPVGHLGPNVQQAVAADTISERGLAVIQPQLTEETSALVCTLRRHSVIHMPAKVTEHN